LNAAAQTNFRNYVIEIAWFGVAMAATSRFLSVYAIRVGATPLELGWLTSLPYIVLLVSTGLTNWWRGKFINPMTSYHLPSIGFRLVFLLPALTPLFPLHLQPLWLIASITLPALPQGISATIFVSMMREAVPNTQQTPLASKRMMWLSIMTGVGALAFGFWLENVPFPVNYQIMFVLSFVMSLVSHWYVTKVKLPAANPVQANQPQRVSDAVPLRVPAFQRMILCVVIAHIGYFALLPVIPLHLVNNLNADEGFMAVFGMAELIGASVVCLLTDRLIASVGNRKTIALCVIATALASLMMATTHSMVMILIASAITGAAWTAAAVAMFGYYVESTEGVAPHDMTRFTTIYHQMIYIAAFVGPMIGSSMADAGVSLVIVMLSGTLLRLMSGVVILNADALFIVPMRRLREALHL
jgi:MFS family permease